MNRPWVETEEGRLRKLGQVLNCVRCDRLELPEALSVCETTPEYSEKTIPLALRKNHVKYPGKWGIIHVLEGLLIYAVRSADTRQYELKQGEKGIIVPGMPHQLVASGSVSFYIEYFTKDPSVVSL